MQSLNPTLWRTCRVLAGVNRLRLMRLIISTPGQNVTQLAKHLNIGVSDASQELRRLQSRGLLRRTCRGKSVEFIPVADPQVSSASPLLETLKRVFAGASPANPKLAMEAQALGHERRILLARALLDGPQDQRSLAASIQASSENTHWHLNTMVRGGLVLTKGGRYILNPERSELAETLLGLLRGGK